MSDSGRPTGRQLMRLLELDGWQRGGRRTHGVFFYKQFPGEHLPRSTVIPDKSFPLPDRLLGVILSVKQTGLGKDGLNDLIKRHRLG